MTTAATTKTPGYNTRIAVWFDTDRKGRELAYRWSYGRAIRMPLAEAEALVATEDACVWPGHPYK